MSTESGEKHLTADVRESNAGKPRKAPYVAPQLQVYGSVAQLTLGANGSVADGGMSAGSMMA